MTGSARQAICAAILVASLWAPIRAVGGGKDDLVGGMEQYAGIRFTERLSGDYKNGDTLNAVVTDVEKFRKLGVGAPGLKRGDPVTVRLLDKDSSTVAIIDNARRTAKNFTVGDFGTLTPAPVSAAAARPPTLSAPANPRLSVGGKEAIVVPRENCGTFWTGWTKDPGAENPCPANCERGERLAVKEHKNGEVVQYQANYRCYLPELVVHPRPGPALEASAPPRTNCGTFWTARQRDPNADVNPCPDKCERGELLDIRRGRSGDGLFYEMNYRCYLR